MSNPTDAEFSLDLSSLAASLAAAVAAPYRPDPAGLLSAREAVAGYYRDDSALRLDPKRVVLTVSTSEAYSFLFRLLCDPGDEVLYLQPGYPLFDYLAALDDVILKPASWLRDADGWHLDRGGLQSALNARTQAVLVVHPNNPTGHYTSPADRDWLDEWCSERGLALIVDEVFLDYSLDLSPSDAPTHRRPASFLAKPAQAMTFVLSGISKVSALPQMKVAWIALHGPEDQVLEAADRLDVIADTFLSLNTPMQTALPELLAVRRQIQPQILERLRCNLAMLDAMLASSPHLSRDAVSGGWYVTLRLPSYEPSESSAVQLLERTGVYVHPGSFFGYEEEGVWVLSMLTPPHAFRSGCSLIGKHLAEFE